MSSPQHLGDVTNSPAAVAPGTSRASLSPARPTEEQSQASLSPTRPRQPTGQMLERKSSKETMLMHMKTGGLQCATSLPTDTEVLRHACTMPVLHDKAAPRFLGLFTLKQLVGLFLGAALFIVFAAGRFITLYSKANDMLAVTMLMACFWAFEVIPIYVTSLLPMIFLPFMSITSTRIVAEAYFNDIQLLYIGMFMVNIAVEEVGLPKRLALTLLRKTSASRPAVALGVFMLLSWVMAMCTNSIVTALMMTPLAVRFLNGAFEAAVAAQCEEGESGDSNIHRSLHRFSDGLLLGIAFSAACGGLATLNGTPANGVLAGEEHVGSVITWSRWFAFALPVSCLVEVAIFVVIYVRFAWNLKIELSTEVLETEHEEMIREIGYFSRDELLVGLLLVAMMVLLIICPFAITPYISPGMGIKLVNGASISCLCAVLLFLLPSSVRPGEALLTWKQAHEKLDIGVLLLIGGGFALASGFVQSGFSDVLGHWIGSRLIPNVHPLVLTLIIVVLVALMVQVFSNAATAAIVLQALGAASMEALVNPLPLMLPATLACSFAFMLPTAHPANVVVLALSSDLPRPLPVRKFISTGSILVLISIAVATLFAYLVEGQIFNAFEPFPQYACESSASFCCWLDDMPGKVQDEFVTSQACALSDHDDGLTCRLWNGTVLKTESYCRMYMA